MGIEELVHIGDNSTAATTSDMDESTIELEPLEKTVLITAASPYYPGNFVPQVMSVLSFSEREYYNLVKSIKRKLDVSDREAMFAALCIALNNGVVTIEEVLEGKNLIEELPKFKVSLRKLTRAQKRIMAEFYNHTVEYHGVTSDEVAETLQYTYGGLIGTISQVRGELSTPQKLGIYRNNRAQLAFLSYIYMHFMHNPVEEQLTGNQLDALEALVIKTDTESVYKSSRMREALNVQTSMEAVLKSLDMGFYTLLLEADIQAFVSLDPAQIDFLRDISNPVVLSGDKYTMSHIYHTTERIYRRLGIHTRAQLAPYLFLAAKLDENEMELLRHTSQDGDPMRIIYEKFGIPEGAALLAPSKYLAVKREMAAKNS